MLLVVIDWLLFSLRRELLCLYLSSHGNHGFMLFGCWWVYLLNFNQISVEGVRPCSFSHCGVDNLVFSVHVLPQVCLVFWLVEIESDWYGKFGSALIPFQLVVELFMNSLEIWDWSRSWWLEAKIC